MVNIDLPSNFTIFQNLSLLLDCLISETFRNELDGLDSADKYPDPFQIVLNLDYKSIEPPPAATEEVWYNRASLSSDMSKAGKQLLFQTQDELIQFTNIFGMLELSFTQIIIL